MTEVTEIKKITTLFTDGYIHWRFIIALSPAITETMHREFNSN